jgi:hypothetical protein
MENADHYITRWQTAGLLDASTADAIRGFEASHAKPASRQWQVLLALILGGILLGAGVLLFVAAHWDAVSPIVRLALVLSMLVFFHGLALLTRGAFSGFATAMHALGTVSAGAAIALVGQIFNMNEHWPAAVLLWALCAAAGWYLLRDPFQQTLTLLLVPAWIASEFCFRVAPYAGSEVYLGRFFAVLGAVYLAAFLRARQRAVFGILFGVGGLMLAVAVELLSEGFRPSYGSNPWGFVPLSWRVGTLVLIASIAVISIAWEWRSSVPVALAIVVGYLLPWAQGRISDEGFNGRTYTYTGPNVFAYVLVAAAAIGLVVWGVHIASKALVNYGTAAFALSVMWFYFSSVMDKLGRSLGLIGLGVLFLAGGWALEQTRRRLVGRMQGGLA